MRPHHRFFVVLSLVATGARANSAIVGGDTGYDAVEVLRSNVCSAIASGDVSRVNAMVMVLAGPFLLLAGAVLALRRAKKPWRAPFLAVLGVLFAVAAIVAAVFLMSPRTERSQTSTSSTPAAVNEIAWVRITNTSDALGTFDAVMAGAKAAHQPVFIDFGADWCIACKKLDTTTFVDAAVRAEAARFVGIKVDTTTETTALNAIQERFGVVGLPTIAFIGSDGVYLDPATQAPRYEAVTGYVAAREFLPQLQRVK